jgi:hypothetical protein
MRYLALVVDYDGTLATGNTLSDAAAIALERLRVSGRRAILVTGRRLDDLFRACPRLQLFDLVVAENGAVLYDPQNQESAALANSPPRRLIERSICCRTPGGRSLRRYHTSSARRSRHGASWPHGARDLVADRCGFRDRTLARKDSRRVRQHRRPASDVAARTVLPARQRDRVVRAGRRAPLLHAAGARASRTDSPRPQVRAPKIEAVPPEVSFRVPG